MAKKWQDNTLHVETLFKKLEAYKLGPSALGPLEQSASKIKKSLNGSGNLYESDNS